MRPRSYAGGGADATAAAAAAAADQPASARRWLLFVRETHADAFALTAVARGALFELQLDERGLRRHIEDLGIEVELSAFVELFKATLENRASVDVAADASGGSSPLTATVVLTYTFGASISRKGRFELPLVAKDVPEQVVELLAALHAAPNEPVLSEAQTHAREAAARAAASAASALSTASSTPTLPFAFSRAALSQRPDVGNQLQNGGADTSAAPTVNPQVLKRRHVPSGTARRKGPKGAKLAKN